MKRPGMAIRWTSTVAVAMVGPILVGCGGAPTDGHSREGGAVVVQDAKGARPAAARPYIGKPRPPVTVSLKDRPDLELGVPGEMRLTVRADLPLARLDLVVEGDRGLTVTGVEALVLATSARETKEISISEETAADYRVLVMPLSTGPLSVSGQVRFLIGGVEQAAPFRVRVTVYGQTSGPASGWTSDGEQEPFPVSDSTDELIIPMVAETTHIPR